MLQQFSLPEQLSSGPAPGRVDLGSQGGLGPTDSPAPQACGLRWEQAKYTNIQKDWDFEHIRSYNHLFTAMLRQFYRATETYEDAKKEFDEIDQGLQALVSDWEATDPAGITEPGPGYSGAFQGEVNIEVLAQVAQCRHGFKSRYQIPMTRQA